MTIDFNDASQAPILNARQAAEAWYIQSGTSIPRLPEHCILTFYPALPKTIRSKTPCSTIKSMLSLYPYTIFTYKDRDFAMVFPGFGAPSAVMILEQSIALGARSFIFFGTAGILDKETGGKELILPSCAYIDEGTSPHYEDGTLFSESDPKLLSAIRSQLQRRALVFQEGAVWSTDAPFRETPDRIRHFRGEGCIAVDMEASALFTVAKRYKAEMAGLFLSRDGVFEERWEPRLPQKRPNMINPSALVEIAADAFIDRDNC